MSNNRDSDISAKFQAFNFIFSKIPFSPVLQELLRKGNTESIYWLNLNCISDSDSNSDSDMSSVLQQICVLKTSVNFWNTTAICKVIWNGNSVADSI